MPDARPLVQNAADPKQVKAAGRKEKQNRELELNDLRAVLATESGRRLLWRLLGYSKVFAEVFDESPNRTAFNAGVRNVGVFLTGEITAADETAFFLMMREARERQEKQANEAEAIRTSTNEGNRETNDDDPGN